METKSSTLDRNVSAAPVPEPAGFWIRCWAAIIDFLILAVVLAMVVSFLSVAVGSWRVFLALRPGMPQSGIIEAFGRPFLFAVLVFFVVSGWLYFALMESSPSRSTVGKRILNLYVADVNGKRIGFWQASRRFAAGRLLINVPYVGLFYFFCESLRIGLATDKRALHDVLGGTAVLRRGEDISPACGGVLEFNERR
jgi:uncharacterized RDD family membrane protein YckC